MFANQQHLGFTLAMPDIGTRFGCHEADYATLLRCMRAGNLDVMLPEHESKVCVEELTVRWVHAEHQLTGNSGLFSI